jgi:dUTP pyrophosphatase
MYRANQPISFYMFTRSSMSKTNFRLSNSVGIIDSGYRGTIGAFFDAYPWQNDTYMMTKGSRVVQLCSPTLEPFMVSIVDSIDSLGQTDRGAGGFGSTGV